MQTNQKIWRIIFLYCFGSLPFLVTKISAATNINLDSELELGLLKTESKRMAEPDTEFQPLITLPPVLALPKATVIPQKETRRSLETEFKTETGLRPKMRLSSKDELRRRSKGRVLASILTKDDAYYLPDPAVIAADPQKHYRGQIKADDDTSRITDSVIGQAEDSALAADPQKHYRGQIKVAEEATGTTNSVIGPVEDSADRPADPQRTYRGQAKSPEEADRMTNALIDSESGTNGNNIDGAFFAQLLKPNLVVFKDAGMNILQLQSKANKVLKPFEDLMNLDHGDVCDTSLIPKADSVIQYLGNLESVSSSDVEEYLRKAEEVTGQSKQMCDFRRFLMCDSKSAKCNYIVEGVVDLERRGPKTIYKLGDGGTCFNFPKIFDFTVEVKCSDNMDGNCNRKSPGRCTCRRPGGCSESNALATNPKLPIYQEYSEQMPMGSVFMQDHLKVPALDSAATTSKLVHKQDCTQGQLENRDDCDSSLLLTCQVDPMVQPSAPERWICECKPTHAISTAGRCLLGPQQRCKQRADCASGICLLDRRGGSGSRIKTCFAHTKGLFFVESVHLKGTGSALTLSWISSVSIIFVTILTIADNHFPSNL